MKLTPERLEELKETAEEGKTFLTFDPQVVLALIADLEEAQRRISISEAFAKELSSELITTRKQLAEAQALIHAGQPTLDSSSIESVVAFWSTQCWRRAALDAAIAEAIADEKRNPWKQAIINELAVSYVLHTDHETDPVRALAALVDYECKVALDPAVSKEAQALIEPYRKDAERLDLLGKLCKEIPLRPNAFCSEIAPDTRLKYEFPTLVSYDAIGQQISLRDAIDALHYPIDNDELE